eukprot:TRINITY_DN2838_c1_g2_i2.p1 TRINITY_DN2838_c1_g2~~TRINITY_DN2838_c1_g2_i2.p1  ORF type:complete len:494 (-),score=137.61 TRINITY_DN2838_c1_g2_i2:789-2270(-)
MTDDKVKFIDNVDEFDGPMEVESLCMNCHEKGTTNILLTRIPFFKEVVVMAFKCPHCGYRDHTIEEASEIQDYGINFKLKVEDRSDLDRQVVKSQFATIRIPELDANENDKFIIPAESQRGMLNTVEGILRRLHSSLAALQPERYIHTPEVATAIDAFLLKVEKLMNLEVPFTLILDDPSGNSFIQSPYAPHPDPNLVAKRFVRTEEQSKSIGLSEDAIKDSEQSHKNKGTNAEVDATSSELNRHAVRFQDGVAISGGHIAPIFEDQTFENLETILSFPIRCPACKYPAEERMFITDIPYFKEVIIMCASCTQCGYRSADIKCGGAIPEKGTKLKLEVLNMKDLSRDFLKSDTASLEIPQLGLFFSEGFAGAIFTTVEGVLDKMITKLEVESERFKGDSSTGNELAAYQTVIDGLKEFKTGNKPFTLLVDDPLSNSYIMSLTPPVNDEQLIVEEYERTDEQDTYLGIKDMNVDNYIEHRRLQVGEKFENPQKN